MNEYRMLNDFLKDVLQDACTRDASSIIFRNHKYPIWAEVIGDKSREIPFKGKVVNRHNLLAKLFAMRMQEGSNKIHFCGRARTMMFILDYNPDEITLTRTSVN